MDDITRIWRQSPTSSSDSKKFYNISECQCIEDKVDEGDIMKIKLPLISKRSVRKEDITQSPIAPLGELVGKSDVLPGHIPVYDGNDVDEKIGFEKILPDYDMDNAFAGE